MSTTNPQRRSYRVPDCPVRREDEKLDNGYKPGRAWIAYEEAAKSANSQVLGSVRASMNLHAIRVRLSDRTRDHKRKLTAPS
jgi:hypothetical protein